jgi:hypothetical protein
MRKLLAATALALTLFACSDDSGDDSAGDATATADAAEEGAATDETGTAGGGFTGEGSEEFCEFAAEVDEVGEEGFERLGEIYDDAIERAPDEIRDDFQRLRDAFRDYVDTLEELGVEDGDVSGITDPEQIARLTEIFSDPEISEATDRVSTYITEVCGLE